MSYTLEQLRKARNALMRGDQLTAMKVLNHLIERMELIWNSRFKRPKTEVQQEITYDNGDRAESETVDSV